MAQKAKKTGPQKPTLTNEGNEGATLWTRHGMEDVYFQRDAMVNFWTVLGGIAVAALLTQMSNLIEGIQRGRWYLLLYFVTSIMLIVNSWVQQFWGSLVLRLRLTMLHSFLTLTNLTSLAILCLQVTKPLAFFAACGCYILFALFIQLYAMKSGAWIGFTPERIKGIKTTLLIYMVFMVLCFGAAANLFWIPSVAAEVGWGVFAILATFAAMVMQHYGMEQERQELGIP
jgi:hypothetical protein